MNLPRADASASLDRGRHQGLEVIRSVGHCGEYHHTDVVALEVLLVLEVLIGREEDLKASGGYSQ